MKSSPVLDRPQSENRTDQRPRLQLSATQVIASALAAITATVAASYLGVAGTVIGAALASVLTVTGNAVYSHSIRRTGERVRTVVPVAARFAPRPMPVAEPAPDSSTRPARGWPVLAAACLGVFAAVLFVVTAFELVEGRPLSDVVRGTSGSGTSVLGDAGRASHVPARPAPTVTVTVTPKVVTTTPTVTVTGTPATKTVDPTPTSTPTPTPTPSVSPSGSTSGSDASGGSSP